MVQMHDPELYCHDRVAERVHGFSAVGEAEIQHFRDHGWLAVDNAFSSDAVAAAIDGFVDLIEGKNPDFKSWQAEPENEAKMASNDGLERQDTLRKLMFFVEFEPRLREIAYHPALMELLARIIGTTDLLLFQDMGLMKPPRIGSEKPWHQDCAYFDLPLGTQVVGAWIALDDVVIDNGCMHVLDRGHREGPQIHFHRRDWQICDTDVGRLHDSEHDVVAVPLKPGGCLFFDGLLPHGTPHNRSDLRRRAVQYHYRAAGVESTTPEERLALFGEEGKDVEC